MPFSFNILSTLFLVLVSCLILSCTKENSENFTIEVLYVESELTPYFEKFAEEGQKRGINIDLEKARIEGFLIDIAEKDVVGQCSYSATSTKKVNIDLNYWNKASDLEKEFVVFHELGHCYLERSHLDTKINNGNCVSMMHSGTSGCKFRYIPISRNYYLDELFQ